MDKSLILDFIKYAKLILLLILLLLSFTLFSQELPKERSVDWTQAGTDSKDTPVENIINIRDFGAAGDGLMDETTSLNQAFSSFAGLAGVVYFPPGNYLFGSPINLPSNIILRGASPDSSFLIFDFYDCNAYGCISISGHGNSSNEQAVLNELIKGSKSIELQDVSNFLPGDYIEIYQDNGEWDIKPASWANDAIGQVVQINSIQANRLILKDELRIDYDLSLNPRIIKITPAENSGIEFLHLKRTNCSADASGYNILFNRAVNCWILGVESAKSYQSHVMINSSSNIEISGSYFHHSFEYDGAATHGYGITLNNHSGQCLIQDNIFKHLRHAMMVKKGANGNVIAYNYSVDPFRTEIPNNAGADISVHGHYAYANLIEGNIVQNIVIDHYWGPSGPLNTFLRNRAELYGIIMTTSARETNSQNFIGNETTNTTRLFGNFILTGSDHYSYGNNITGTIIPVNTNESYAESYYLNKTPLFWNISASWPSIGFPNELDEASIPAKERYVKGVHYTVYPAWGDDTTTNSISRSQMDSYSLDVYPNPFINELHITAGNDDQYSLINMNGECVLNGEASFNRNTIINTESISAGTYLLRVQSGNETQNIRILKLN